MYVTLSFLEEGQDIIIYKLSNIVGVKKKSSSENLGDFQIKTLMEIAGCCPGLRRARPNKQRELTPLLGMSLTDHHELV